MAHLTRREFVEQLLAWGAVCAGSPLATCASAAGESRRKFTKDLVCGAIRVQADQREAIRLAKKYGFESVAPAPNELARLAAGELRELCGELRESGLVWGAAGLPVEFRRDAAAFQAGLAELPPLAQALQRAGVSRVGTWLRPGHESLTFLANFRQHCERLREIARVLADQGLRFGLEYVGPKTSWTANRYPFVHTMAEARELIAELGQTNVGLVLDSWHWYTAQETKQDLLKLSNADIVACDLNDAPAGIAVEAQVDSRRDLPAATGVIDLQAFLTALVEIGYDGPVRAEPFKKELADLAKEEAVATTSAALDKAFELVKS